MSKRCSTVCLLLALGCAPEAYTEPEVSLYKSGDPDPLGDCSKTPCKLVGGKDRLVVRVVYQGVKIDHSTKTESPTLTLLEDGKVSVGPTMTGLGLDPRVFESEPYLTPPRTVARLAVQVVGDQGYQRTVTGLSIEAPKVELDGGCASDKPTCVIASGRATFAFRTYVPLDTPVKIFTWVDDVPQGLSAEPQFDIDKDGEAYGWFSLPVPEDGSSWELQALVGSLASERYEVSLVAE